MKYTLIFTLLLSMLGFGQLELEPDDESGRLKYGLSQAEWGKYKESGLSIKELEKLIGCGITINEYMSRPWISLGVSENAWIDERCKGMSDEAIQAFSDKGESDWSVILAFLLPGSYHWTHRSYGKGAAFTGFFILPLTLFFVLPEKVSEPKQKEEGLESTGTDIKETKRPIFLVFCVADMVLSAVFAYRDHYKTKPEMQDQTGLHLDYHGERAELKYVYRF
jgi:hypothetical protein